MTTIYDPIRDGKNWQKYGACTVEEPLLFEPVNEISTHPAIQRQISRAKTVCCRCPVIEQCLRDALLQRSVDGIRAGLTGPERALLLCKKVRPPHESVAARTTASDNDSEADVLTDTEQRRLAQPAVVAEQRRRSAANQRVARAARKASLNTGRRVEGAA